MLSPAPTLPPQIRNDSWFAEIATRLRTVLFGYDFFICYRTADGAAYARSLHAKLTAARFDCFLDVKHYEAGHNLTQMQSQALKRSTKLLVVVSPLAHVPPTNGTDWVLAEVREFKYVAAQRRAPAKIVPIGTPRTLDADRHPDSKLLPEMPSFHAGDICVLDNAVERNGEPEETTVEKLNNDFTEGRRRRVRHGLAAALAFAVVGATVFGVVSRLDREKDSRLATALGLVDRGRDELDGGGVGKAHELFARSEQEFGVAGKDPILALHGRFAAESRQLRATVLTPISREADFLKFSADGNWLLVVHDYQAPSGDPEVEAIGDWTACGVFNLRDKKWTLRPAIDSPVGKEIYGVRPHELIEFEPPHHVTIQRGDECVRVSLADGTKTAVPARASPPELPPRGAGPLEQLLAGIKLFTRDPNDVINEYSPRLVEQTRVEAPDGRTAIVGTYEGRLILFDLLTRSIRGELQTDTIYTAAYRPDSRRAYFCDKANLWEIDTVERPGAREATLPLRKDPNPWRSEKVLAISLADDASVLALATTERLFSYRTREAKWREWTLPRRIEGAAALAVDTQRRRVDFVAADDGTTVSADYALATSSLDVVARPGGPQPSVACFDSVSPSVWLTTAKAVDCTAQIQQIGLPGQRAEQRTLPAIRLRERTTLGDDPLAIHAIARLGTTIAIFHGDSESYRERSQGIDDEMTTLSLRSSGPSSKYVLFPASVTHTGVGAISTCVQVRTVLPSPANGRLLVRTDSGEIHEVGLDGRVEKSIGGLFGREYSDGGESYVIGIDAKENDVSLHIRHRRTGTWLKYKLACAGTPAFGAITPNGRHAVLAGEAGDILLWNVAREPWPAPPSGK